MCVRVWVCGCLCGGGDTKHFVHDLFKPHNNNNDNNNNDTTQFAVSDTSVTLKQGQGYHAGMVEI